MVATAVTFHLHPHNRRIPSHYCLSNHQFSFGAAPLLFRCSRRIHLERGLSLTREARAWGVSPRGGMTMGDYGDYIDEDDDEDEEEEEEEEDEDRSLDLLIKFVENVFRKVSRRARKAVKSVLPVPISTRLVGFAVNGTIILTFLWVLKAFLQVICTLGSVVFASILLIRGIWTGISYFQESRNYRADDDKSQPWPGSQPAV